MAIDRAAINELKTAIQGTTAKGAGRTARQAIASAQKNLAASVKDKFGAARAAVERRNDAYDLATHHGLN